MLLQSIFEIRVAGIYIYEENGIHCKQKILHKPYTDICYFPQNKGLYNQENQQGIRL